MRARVKNPARRPLPVNLHRGLALTDRAVRYRRLRSEPLADIDRVHPADDRWLAREAQQRWVDDPDRCNCGSCYGNTPGQWVDQVWASLDFFEVAARTRWPVSRAKGTGGAPATPVVDGQCRIADVRAERLVEVLAPDLVTLFHQNGLPMPPRFTSEEAAFFRDLKARCRAEGCADVAKPAVALLALLAPVFVRPVRGWQHPGGPIDRWLRSLVDHLLVVYPVPEFLYRPWLNPAEWIDIVDDLHPGAAVAFFVMAAQGASLHRVAPHFGWRVPRWLQGYLHTTPESLSFMEAMLWVHVRRYGGAEQEFERLRRHGFRPYLQKGEGPQEPHPRGDLLQATVAWLVSHRDRLTDETADMALQWARHMVIERRWQFSWKGRTVASVVAQAERYHAAINRRDDETPRSWASRGWNRTIAERDVEWTLMELTSSKELLEEGFAQRHCVGSYACRCAAGASAIVSLRRDGERAVTIEVDPETKQIVQVAGRFNRSPAAQELGLIRAWLRTVVRGGESQ